MNSSPSTLTLTLHWQGEGRPHEATVACDDSPPRQLLPILVHGCGLPLAEGGYRLSTGAGGRGLLDPERPLSAQGLSSGGHLWLLGDADRPARGHDRCLLEVAAGVELVVPRGGLTLTRSWLLRAMELLAPEVGRRELEQLEQRSSPYRYVSNRAHCRIGHAERGGWSIVTERSDVSTSLNGARLRPSAPAALQPHDQLRLGDGGPVLVIHLV